MGFVTDLTYRVFITALNILFPPLAVLLIAGPGYDCVMNCLLFLLAILPSHIHGFYISCVYFHRKSKVRKGHYPGGPKTFIESKNVLNGGASPREVERLYMKEKGVAPGRAGSRKRSTSRGGGISRGGTVKSTRREGSQLGRGGSVRSRIGHGGHDERVARDGYGPPMREDERGRAWYA